MSVHIAPMVLHLRIFDGDIAVDKPLYAMSNPYKCHIIAVINDLGVARLEGLNGRLSLSNFREIFKKLADYGVRRVEWRHHRIEKHRDLNGH